MQEKVTRHYGDSKYFLLTMGKKKNYDAALLTNTNITGCQHKLHKKVSDVLLCLCLIDHWWVNPIDNIGEISEVAQEESNQASVPSKKMEDVDGPQKLDEVDECLSTRIW